MKMLGSMLVMVLTLASSVSADFVFDEHGKRDPFVPLVSASGTVIADDADLTVSDMHLEGILADSTGNNLAIINGKMVKASDQVGSWTVESISQDQVAIVKGQDRSVLKLKKGGI